MPCLRCLRFRRSRDRSPSDDDDSEDSEVYWIRRRREEQQRQKTVQRQEFLDNVLRTKKTIIVETEDPVDPSSDEFIIPPENDMCCAVCLLPYEHGDLVSFSHNPSCQHHFHRSCIMSWLKENNACPCCRQDYLAFGDDDDDEQEEEPRDSTPSTTPNNPQEDDQNGISQHIFDQLYGTGIFQSTDSVPRDSNNMGMEDPPETRAQIIRTVQRLSQHMEQHVSVARTQLRDRLYNLGQRLQELPVQQPTTGISSSHREDERRWERSVELVRDQVDRLRGVVVREIQHRRDRDHTPQNTDHERRHDTRSASRFEGADQQNMRLDDRLGQAVQAVQSNLRLHAGNIMDSIRNHRGGSLRAPSR